MNVRVHRRFRCEESIAAGEDDIRIGDEQPLPLDQLSWGVSELGELVHAVIHDTCLVEGAEHRWGRHGCVEPLNRVREQTVEPPSRAELVQNEVAYCDQRLVV